MANRTVKASCERAIAICLSGLLVFLSAVPAAAQQAPAPSSATGVQQGSGSSTEETSNSDTLPNAPASQAPAPHSSSSQQGSSTQPQNNAQTQQPAGTAAAGIENTAGNAASKPAGVAVAPPKQRRVRLLVIKVGAILGAGAAIGTVAALSKASPSKPPGAH